MTSMTWSGPTTPAVSSSTPRPSSIGFWAIRLSSRPSRFRCWKCWSTITPGQQPEARGDLRHPVLGRGARGAERDHVARDGATRRRRCRPPRHRPWKRVMIASARRVPPIIDDRRSWLPPVRKMPVASRTIRAALLVVRLGPGHRVERPHVRGAELGEHLAVPLARLRAERRCGRDHGDLRLAARRRARRTGRG